MFGFDLFVADYYISMAWLEITNCINFAIKAENPSKFVALKKH